MTAESSIPHPVFDSLEQEVYLNLWRTYDRLKALEEQVFERFDLTAQQYNALRLLDAAAPERMATLALAARLVTRAPDITRLVDKLERRGWVDRRRRAGNRRFVEVTITPAGSALLASLKDDVLRCHQQQLGHLTSDEATALAELLRRARRPHEDQPPERAAPAATSLSEATP